MKTKNKKNKGFTLIELIVVIAILAILAAVAIPNFISLINRAEDAVVDAAAAQYVNAVNVFNTIAAADGTTKIVAKPATLAALDTALGSYAPQHSLTAAQQTSVLGKISISDTGFATLN